MVPFIGWLLFLFALGHVFGAFVYGPLEIAGITSFLLSMALGIGLTLLGMRLGVVSRFWFQRDR